MVLGKQVGDRFLVGLFSDRNEFRAHEVLNGFTAIRCEQITQRDHAEQMLERVESISIVDRLHLRRLLTQIRQGFVGRHFGSKTGEARIHTTTRLIFAECQQGPYFTACGLIQV